MVRLSGIRKSSILKKKMESEFFIVLTVHIGTILVSRMYKFKGKSVQSFTFAEFENVKYILVSTYCGKSFICLKP